MGRKSDYVLMPLLLVIFLMFGCGPQIFKANFDTDSLGRAPSAAPPGDPSGDRIIGSRNTTVVDDAIIGSRAVRFHNTSSITEASEAIVFTSANVPLSNKKISYTFVGYAEGNTHREFIIYFTSTAPSVAAEAFKIAYIHGSMILFDGEFVERGSVLGSYEAGKKQVLIVSLDRDTNTYNLYISQAGGLPTISLNNRPIRGPSFWGQSSYALKIAHHPTHGTTNPANRGYVIDEVIITKEKMEEN